MPKVPKTPSPSTVRITRRALYDRDVVDARDRLELRGGRRKHDARRLCPNLTAPARRRSWGGAMSLAARASAPIAGLVVALGGFAALSLARTLVAAVAILALFFVRRAA